MTTQQDTLQRVYLNQLKNIAPLVKDTVKNCYRPNPILLKLLPYDLVFDPQNNDSAVQIAANGTADRRMTLDMAGSMLIQTFKGVATSNDYLVQVYDVEYGRYLMNRAVHAETIIGTGPFPFKLPIPLLISKTQSINNTLTDQSGAPNTVRFAFGGQRLYFRTEDIFLNDLGDLNRKARPFFYTTDQTVTLANNTNIQSFITTIQEDADFLLYRITRRSTGNFLVRIFDTLNMYPWTNGFVHSAVIGGTNINYMDIEPQPLAQRKTKIQLDFINLAGASNTVNMTFSGVHLYYDRKS